MDGNALFITVAIFFGIWEGAVLFNLELELNRYKLCRPATLLRALAGWLSVLRWCFLADSPGTLCGHWPFHCKKNKSMQMVWSNNSIGTHQLNCWNVVLHRLFKAISWSSQGTCMLLVKLYYRFVEYVYNLPFLLLYSSDIWLSIKV